MLLYFSNLDFCYIDPVHSSSSSSSSSPSPSPSSSFACLPFLLSFLSDSRKSFLSNYIPIILLKYLGTWCTLPVPDAKKHPTSHHASPPEKRGNKPFSSPQHHLHPFHQLYSFPFFPSLFITLCISIDLTTFIPSSSFLCYKVTPYHILFPTPTIHSIISLPTDSIILITTNELNVRFTAL